MVTTRFAIARRCFVLAFCLLAAAGGVSHAQPNFPDLGSFGDAGDGLSEISIEAEFTAPTEDSPALLFVTAKIADGFHISATDQKEGGPLVTKISVGQSDSTMKVVDHWKTIHPPKVYDSPIWNGLEIREHEHEVTWYTPLNIAPGTDLATLAIEVMVVGQVCKESCILFEEKATALLGKGVPLPAQDSAAPADTVEPINLNLLPILGYGILGGLILNLMPCVLPVLGLKLMSFAKQGGQSRVQILKLNLCYAAGLLTVFMVLATLAMLVQLGLGTSDYGWGELNTETWFKVGMVALVFSMAISFLGVWEIPIPGFASSGKATELSSREGPFGAFCMGMFTTILAVPCSGPLLGPVLGSTLGQPPSIIYTIFASMGLGMALPYLLIGTFPSLVNWLPKPGAWMDTLKQLMGFVLLATVVYLFWSINHAYFMATLALIFSIWFACWIVGRVPLTAPGAQRGKAWLQGIAVVALVGGVAFMPSGKSVLPWQEYTPQALAEAQAEGKTVMVDFTANWCPTCKMNLLVAINRSNVKKWVEANGVVTLLADWTDRNDAIKQALLEHKSRSIPLLVVYPADRTREPIVLRDLLTQARVLEALAQAGPSVGFEGGDGDKDDTVMSTSSVSTVR